jgi:hypothetical protein
MLDRLSDWQLVLFVWVGTIAVGVVSGLAVELALMLWLT